MTTLVAHHRRRVAVLLGCVALVTVAVVIGLVISAGGATDTDYWDDNGQFVCAALASAASGVTAARLTDRRRRSYALIAAGTGSWALGELAYNYYQLVTPSGVVPSPGLPDVGFLVLPVTVLAGLLSYPAARVTGRARLTTLMDGIVVASSLFLLTWVTALGQAFHESADSWLSRIVNMAYPAGDVLLLVATLFLVSRSSRARRTSLLILLTGLSAVSISDSGYVYLNALGSYSNYPVIDTGWWCGFLLVGVAALSEPLAPQRAPQSARQTRWQLLLPYPAVVLSVVVLVREALLRDDLDTADIVVAIVMMAAVLSRQFLALADNFDLVTQVRMSESAMRYQAFHDQLTQLPNRAAFTSALRAAVEGSDAVGIVYVDLDDFKLVNDTWGHPVGDQLLREVAGRLSSIVRTGETVARLGGDEFAVLVTGAGSAAGVAARLLAALQQPAQLPVGEIVLRASVGVVERSPGCDPDTLLRDSDTAMYAAKRHGGGWQVFQDDEHTRVAETLGLRGDLGQAIDAAENRGGLIDADARDAGLYVAYQPILDARTGETRAYEALVRWNHPVRGAIGPDVFVRIAEEAGLAARLDRLVLAAALAQLARWRLDQPGLNMSVNASPHHLRETDVAEVIISRLAEAGLPGTSLILEVTESALLADPAGASLIFSQLVAAGVRIALDDFGTGWSSLHRLTQMPVSILKVDRAFVADMSLAPGWPGAPSRAKLLLEGIIGLGKALGVTVCAEGVETQAELDMLRAAGVDSVQGYLLGRPKPASSLGITALVSR